MNVVPLMRPIDDDLVLEADEALSGFPATELGNAEMFAAKYGARVRYDHSARVWRIWKAHYWALDRDGAAQRYAKEAIRGRLAAAALILEDDRRKQEIRFTLQSENRRALDAMLALAATEEPIAANGESWDQNPLLFGVRNGVVDLQSGQLRDGRPEDGITRVSPAIYDAMARCPRWESFVKEIFARQPDLADYFQRVIGYSLTGLTTEQVLWILFGLGANGKTTCMETLFTHVFGLDYAWTMPFPAGDWNDSMSEYQKAALAGRRLVQSSEVTHQRRLNEEFVKSLTGGDTVSARHPYGRPFQFVPTAKYFIRVNDKPQVRDNTHGMWRRIRLIPFEQTFQVDTTLAATLASEAAGILQWAIRGCLAWQKEGLCEPEIVGMATAEYRTENDQVTEFLNDCCVVLTGVSVRAGVLYQRYCRWAEHQPPQDRLTQKAFGLKMKAKFDSNDSGRHVVYLGVALVSETSEDEVSG